MSVNIIGYPSKIVNGNPVQVSKWNSVHQPIQYIMQRQDVSVSQAFTYDTTTLEVQINAAFAGGVGDYIYLSSGVLVGTCQVTSVVSNSPIFAIIRVAYDSSMASYFEVGGFLNFVTARANYYVETQILGVDETPAYYTIGTSVNKPDAKGVLIVDAAAFLKSIVAYKDTFPYNVLNKSDRTQGGRFNIIYRECWTGFTGFWSGISSTNLYYYVNSAKQIQEKYGSNMGDYVPFVYTNDSETRSKFMSDFDKPTYFPGYPFSLSFIYSDAIVGTEIRKFEKTKDINGVEMATNNTVLDNSFGQDVNRVMLEEFGCDVGEVDFWLESGDASCRQYVDDDYVDDDYVEEQCGLIDVSDSGIEELDV